jgi:hypothetical protein
MSGANSWQLTSYSSNNAPASDPRLYQTVINLNGSDQVKHLIQISIQDNSTNNQATAKMKPY